MPAEYVAIITDGNGRWAQQRGLPVIEGHRAGADIVRERLRDSVEFGVRELTVYSFSTENWTRPREEVDGLMAMFAERIDKDFTKWSERWERFADRREAEVNSHLTRHNREKLQRLEKASDRNEFDRAYADVVADHLELMAQDFRDTRQKTQTPEIRRLIDDELPLIRDLLTRARQVDAKESQREKDKVSEKQ